MHVVNLVLVSDSPSMELAIAERSWAIELYDLIIEKKQRSPNSESTESMLIDAHPPIFEYVYSSILTLHMEAIGFQHQSTTKFCVDSVTCVPFYRITHRSNSNMSTYDDGFLNSAPTLALTYIHYPEITIANPIAHDTVHSSVKWWRRNVCCFVFLFCSARYIL